MKKILSILILLFGITFTAHAGFLDFFKIFSDPVGADLRTSNSIQEGGTPVDGYILQTDGSKSTWVATSTLGISGTVTSVDMSVPTGLTIAGNPITTSGTLALSLTAGYQMLTDVASTTWDTAYSWGDWNGNIDISTDTNLAVIDPIVLTGDTLSFNGVAPSFTATTTVENLHATGNIQVDGAFFAPVTIVSSGNATINGELYVTGNVGIGTTAPITPLQVKASSVTGILQTTPDFNSGTATGSSFLTLFGASSGNTYTELRALTAGWNTYGNLVMQTGGGNVGIGTTAPAYDLHVAGNAFVTGDMRFTSSNNFIRQSSTTSDAAMYVSSGGDVQVYLDADNDASNKFQVSSNVAAGTTGSELFTILDSGNVGIATTSPAVKLDVNGIIKTQPASSRTCNALAEGGIMYDSDVKKFFGCNGSAWEQLTN